MTCFFAPAGAHFRAVFPPGKLILLSEICIYYYIQKRASVKGILKLPPSAEGVQTNSWENGFSLKASDFGSRFFVSVKFSVSQTRNGGVALFFTRRLPIILNQT